MREYTLALCVANFIKPPPLIIKAEDVEIDGELYNFIVGDITVAYVPIKYVYYTTSREC